jgi:two-component system, cell cycle response regulator
MNSETAKKGNILLVDDLPENLQLLSDLLSKLGYNVRSVTSGRMALKTIQVKPPDLVLLDVKMPEMDGYQVCQALKADPETKKIPVIFISALDDVFDKVAAFEAGGADYITKPFQIAEVMARLEHQLTIQRQQILLQEEIAKQKEMEEILYQSRALLSGVLNSSFDGIAALQAVREAGTGAIEDFRCLVVNPVISKLFERSREDLVGKIVLKRFLNRINPKLFEQFVAITETGTSIEGDFYYPLQESSWYNYSAVKLGDGFTITIRDITARKEIEMELRTANQKLKDISNLDGLTQIPNRRSFDENLKGAWQRMGKQGQALSLMLVDIDSFKTYNDCYGYLAGDNCLIKIVEVIKQCCQTNLEQKLSQSEDSRSEYLVARYGGEEFMILMPNVTRESVIALGTNIQKAIRTLAIPQTATSSQESPKQLVTVSIGISTLVPSPMLQPMNLVAKAYEAIQKAKMQGGDRYCTSD